MGVSAGVCTCNSDRCLAGTQAATCLPLCDSINMCFCGKRLVRCKGVEELVGGVLGSNSKEMVFGEPAEVLAQNNLN